MLVVEKVATPLFTTAVPRAVVEPFKKKVTVLVADDGVTVAVKVTF
jgi:hypothetical protein